MSLENKLWKSGFCHVAGIDEVGRGSWAGPLVVGAVILPQNFKIPKGFNDSKKLKPILRKKFAKFIKEIAISWAISKVEVGIINKKGIGQSTQIAFRKALRNLKPFPQHTLVDAFYIKHISKKTQTPIVGGDQKSASIAAASVIAKVYRDNLMSKMSQKYNLWGFEKHKGYGTKFHQEKIKKYGFCKIHRTSFNLNYLINEN